MNVWKMISLNLYANLKLAIGSMDCDVFVDNSFVCCVQKYQYFLFFSLVPSSIGHSYIQCIMGSILYYIFHMICVYFCVWNKLNRIKLNILWESQFEKKLHFCTPNDVRIPVIQKGHWLERGPIQSESEKMFHFLKVVLFEVWIFNHGFYDMSW